MRIGIDARILRMEQLTGIGFYVYHILRYIAENDTGNEYFLYSNSPLVHHIENGKNFHERIVRGNIVTQPLGTLWMRYSLAKYLKEDKIDVFWGTAFMLPQRVAGIKYVVTIHDLALLIEAKWGRRYNVLLQHLFTPGSAGRADRIITVSDATKRDVVSLCRIDPNKIQTIYLGGLKYKQEKATQEQVDTALTKFSIAGKFLLYLGTLEPRKNIDNVVKSFDLLAETDEEVELVLAGGLGWRYQSILDAIDSAKHKDRIKRLGYVSSEEKVALYAAAQAFLFPSHYEGFGIPVLEAMEMGLPVLTARNSSLPEVAGPSGFYVEDENDVQAMAEQMKAILSMTAEERAARIAQGYSHAATFSWEKCAQETARLLTEEAE